MLIENHFLSTLPDLAAFPDYVHELRNQNAADLASMYRAFEEGDWNKFVDQSFIDKQARWVSKLEHMFHFYRKWRRPDYTVEPLTDGMMTFKEDVVHLRKKVDSQISQLLLQDDWTPPPGVFDRGTQLPNMCGLVQDLFNTLGIIETASAYNRRKLSVANVYLHIAKETDSNWKQFFYDAKTTPKYTNTHIDPKEDVVKAMIYLNDVSTDNGAFGYVPESNRFKYDPLQNIFGRAISTGSYCHNSAERRSVFALPSHLRVSHNFGRMALEGSELEAALDENLKYITSDQANIIVFDPGAGIHQGGICTKGARLALQVLMK